MAKSQNSKKTLRNKCDALLQKIGLKNKPKCIMANKKSRSRNCNKYAQVMHHYYSKHTSNFLRYSFLNVVPLCNNCHCLWHSRNDPDFLHDLDEAMGLERLNYLKKNKNKYVKVNLKWYQDTFKELSELLR